MSQPALLTRPQLLVPVLLRGANEIQIGCSPTTAVLVRKCSQKLIDALRLLDGSQTVEAVAARSGVGLEEFQVLLVRLQRAGSLSSPPNPPVRTIRLLGAGNLGRAFAEKFSATGAAALSLVDPERPRDGLYENPEATGAESLRTHLRRTSRVPRNRLRVGGHWSQPELEPSALTVIALDRLECDRAITDTLLRTDQPHLFLAPGERGVVIGPLVVPGLTACTRCMDLVRCADPAWPRVLSQLCRTRAWAPAPLQDWGAATAVQQALAFLAGGHPETLGSTVEVEPGAWLPTVRTWPNHPECGCQILSE